MLLPTKQCHDVQLVATTSPFTKVYNPNCFHSDIRNNICDVTTKVIGLTSYGRWLCHGHYFVLVWHSKNWIHKLCCFHLFHATLHHRSLLSSQSLCFLPMGEVIGKTVEMLENLLNSTCGQCCTTRKQKQTQPVSPSTACCLPTSNCKPFHLSPHTKYKIIHDASDTPQALPKSL